MTDSADDKDTLSQDLVDAFDKVFGLHPGNRPVHAKGIMLSGTFVPCSEAPSLTRAPHIQRQSTPVSVRFSNFAGVPNVPDNDPQGASPRGIAIRFHLAEHSHTDIIAHSHNGFPVRTAEEFLEFLHALGSSGPDAPKPTPIEKFLGSHPKALEYVQTPSPIPTSFARESYFGVNAYQFTNANGDTRLGRYRIRPAEGAEYLDDQAAGAQSPNFLFDEIVERIKSGPVQLQILVQLAEPGDITDNATEVWPEKRSHLTFGDLFLTAQVTDEEHGQRRVIFDPIPRVDGIDSSADPLLEPRASLYLVSGRRRRAAGQADAHHG